MEKDASDLLVALESLSPPGIGHGTAEKIKDVAGCLAAAAMGVVAASAIGWWLYRRAAERQWARDEAIPQIQSLVDARKPLAAMLLAELRRICPRMRNCARLPMKTQNLWRSHRTLRVRR